jgi:hypothetical protein
VVNYSHAQHPHPHTSLLTGLILRGHHAIQIVLLRIVLLSKNHHLCTTCYINFTQTKESEFTPLGYPQIHYKSTKTFINVRNNCKFLNFIWRNCLNRKLPIFSTSGKNSLYFPLQVKTPYSRHNPTPLIPRRGFEGNCTMISTSHEKKSKSPPRHCYYLDSSSRYILNKVSTPRNILLPQTYHLSTTCHIYSPSAWKNSFKCFTKLV